MKRVHLTEIKRKKWEKVGIWTTYSSILQRISDLLNIKNMDEKVVWVALPQPNWTRIDLLQNHQTHAIWPLY